ncbi:PREDICTED: uncharacterized protein LOC109325004 [Lupinus angustifolius]|uniref:uncharacterized protein LOC109325004 n=1 Tax=Lupinus angustifolius TaxID=3871 RepID=UPI00092EFFF1|nr:PREDICTED: uncharacterized protein LOC109325004 [Lupinus angustifolius]
MADSEANSKMQTEKKAKKRNQKFDAKPQKPSKLQRIDSSSIKLQDLQSPWKNLQLIRNIQDKRFDPLSKVISAFSFVHSMLHEDNDQSCETVKLPRLLCFLNDWIQSLLFPPKNAKIPQLEGINAYMDLRCWEIFNFCLQESLKFGVTLSMSQNLLKPFQLIARNALSLLDDSSIGSGGFSLSDERYKLYDTALDCLSLVFSSHGGVSNEDLMSWIDTSKPGLELVLKVYSMKLDGSNLGTFALRFLWLVLQPLSNFLNLHPARKGNAFRDFVHELLEPLLHLSGELTLRVNESNSIWTGRLMKVVEEVLSHGLFHPVLIGEFLSLHGSEKYVDSCDHKPNDSKANIQSYPKHLFDVLNKIIAIKNATAMASMGLLFHLFVNSARTFKGTSVLYEENKTMEKMNGVRQPVPGENSSSNNISTDTQKSLLNIFVLMMEPLLLKINAYLQAKVDAKHLLLDLCGILKSIGGLLSSFMQEKVYMRTEDTSGGACLNFLKKVFNALISSSTSVLCLSNYDISNRMEMEIFVLSANEILVSMGHLLEIEYEVIGEDLIKLWLIILSYSAINCDSVNGLDQCSLSSSIPALGCQIINLYGQLRQVKIAILALCKAIRLIVSHEGNAEEGSSRLLTFLSNEVYSESVERLLSSQKFIHVIYRAIESIPEGQVSDCIRQITDDISESVRWMKDFSPLVDGKKIKKFNLQMELLGRGLCRLYCLVLDSVTITEGNSNLVGVAIKELVALMRPYLSTLVGQQADSLYMFLSSVMGETVDRDAGKRKVLKKFGRSSQWVVVFFFQLFMSCRSLIRQAISLMPPGLSKKVSAEVGDYTTYSAFDLMERIDDIDIVYFSWIVQPSDSLLVVMQFVSDLYLKFDSDDCCPLIYIFQSMALQRLVDLNKQIVCFKYLQKRRYRSRIKALKEEAAELTNFMMNNLSCLYESPIFVFDDVFCEDVISLAPQTNGWNQGVYVANKKSLPTAIWSNLCKNFDIWGNHASKKQLKKFFSQLLHTSLRRATRNSEQLGVQEIDECKLLKKVSLPQMLSQLLSDSVLYEQKFAHRNLASIFCGALEKSVLPLFSNIACNDLNIQSSPDWPTFFSVIDKSADICRKEMPHTLTDKSFTVAQCLLNLLCWTPDINTKSFSHLVTCIFNLERLLVSALLCFQSTGYQDSCCEYLRLFVSCRKALRYIIMGYCEKTDAIQSSPNSIISESMFPALWISKSVSVTVGIKEAFSAGNSIMVKSLMFALMDHTSYVLLGIGKYQLIHVFSIDKEGEEPCEESSNYGISHEENHLLPSSPQYVDSPKMEALKCLTFMVENLKEQMQGLLVSLKDAHSFVNVGFDLASENVNGLSSAVSCLSGFLWGLTSVKGQTDAEGSFHKEVLMWKNEQASEVNSSIFPFVELVDFFVNKLLVKSNQLSSDNASKSASGLERMSNLESKNSIASVLARADSPEHQDLNKPLLRSLLKGDHPEVAFLLRQLLVASSALLRLNLQKDESSLLSSFVPTFIEISQILLLQFIEMVDVPQQSVFLLLDGVLSYLRELASYFPLTDPTSSLKVYAKLVHIHMSTIGKTILLQGKRATLTFHERQSSTKTLHKGSFEANSSSELYCFYLDEFKTRLRMSFKAYIERPSELHILSTIQAVERALVGVKEGCTMIYDIETSKDGGEISSLVAAGIDCFDMILEFVSGWKGLKLIKRHCQSSVSAVFNIIMHLQNPLIFYVNKTSGAVASNPDPGSTILMCVEVLVTVSRKHALFPMDVWHVGHLLHIPELIFQNFHQLKISEDSGLSSMLTISEEKISNQVEAANFCHVDHRFSIDLFVACCQLLCTTIRHRPSESKQCLAHLQASVAVLLNCLETLVDNELTGNKGGFSWEVKEGVKCACFLRRIYEEIKQQKDIFGRQCSLFLCNYIWVYSGHGPKRSGITREIDEALRPGVYALIDACSVDDLQYLHTVFGEGPCRNTLASLQHDYKLNFKYEGKV